MTGVAAFVISVAAAAQDPASDHPADHMLFKQLEAKVRDIDREYEQVVNAAMNQARARNGRSDLELQAQMLSLREARDRTMSRLVLVASRHGWEVPEFDAEAEAAAKDLEPQVPAADIVFAPAARLVQERFAAEALRIARTMRLPVISLPADE
jgi:hypothetical protein